MQGKLILILGPSGSGKGTLINHAKAKYPDFVFPVSCTTRDPRPGEQDGDVYHFISKEEFKERIAQGEFLEYAVVHNDNYYGTLKSEILEPLEQGKVVFREVDLQGVRSIQELIPVENLTTIFTTTTSWEELAERITGRAPISEEELAYRQESYEEEVKFIPEADHIIYNRKGEIEEAKAELEEVIQTIIDKQA